MKEKQLNVVKSSYILRSPYQLLDKKSNKYLQIISKLETLSPLLTLQRGYSISRCNGNVISSVKNVKKKDIIDIEFNDGTIKTEVI